MLVKALIADDSLFIRDAVRHHLERFGCRVAGEADNASQTIRLFRTLKPDVVTLDVVMPQVDGIDSLQALRKMLQEDPRVKIIVVSAMPFDETRDAFMREGAVDYVIKPFNSFSFELVRQKLEKFFPELRNHGSTTRGGSAAAWWA